MTPIEAKRGWHSKYYFLLKNLVNHNKCIIRQVIHEAHLFSFLFSTTRRIYQACLSLSFRFFIWLIIDVRVLYWIEAFSLILSVSYPIFSFLAIGNQMTTVKSNETVAHVTDAAIPAIDRNRYFFSLILITRSLECNEKDPDPFLHHLLIIIKCMTFRCVESVDSEHL